MSYKAGIRYSNDTYIMTETTDEGVSAVGEINGEPVEFSGGGGDTYELATVTIGSNVTLKGMPVVWFDSSDVAHFESSASTNWSQGESFKVPLINGSILISGVGSVAVVSGDASMSSGKLTITGDCTIGAA